MSFLKSSFNILEPIPAVSSFIPYANNQQVQYFSFHTPESIKDDVSKLWDLFEMTVFIEAFGTVTGNVPLVDLITYCLNVRGIGISKLTSALYWINPHHFLHGDTVNAVGGKDLGIEARDANSYFACLARTKELTRQSLPEINMSVFKTQNPDWDPPKVWIVRGGRRAMAVEEFLTGGYTGVGFAFGDFDISGIRTVDELRRFCDARSLNQDGIDQVVQFLTEIEISDFVLMPGPGSAANYYGRVTSDPYHDRNGTHRNRRDVEWSPKKISRAELDLSSYRSTVTRPNRDVQDRFLEIIKDGKSDDIGNFEFEMPEDSWVPFHSEIGRKLIEREWWLPEKRQEFARIVDQIRWGEGSDQFEIDGNKSWGPDPYSLFDALSIRESAEDNLDVYRTAKGLMGIESEVPIDGHGPFGLRWGWDVPIDDESVDFLWEFFKFAMQFDPSTADASLQKRFIDFYDRASSPDFLPGKRGSVWSYFLYWVDPTKYVIARRLRRKDTGLVDDVGVAEGLPTGAEYIKALKGIQKLGAENGFTVLDVNRKSTTREMLGLLPLTVTDSYTIDNVLDEGVFLERDQLVRMERILRTKQSMVLQGPPGVGKTFIARKLAYVLMGTKAEKRITSVQFHQSYSYEDFVGGFRPSVKGDQMVFERQDGPFLEVCKKARANPEIDYVMLIDEINRGNLSRVFGELLMLIEADKRKPEFGVNLQHRREDDEKFFVPPNVYIIGTMNLADRSLTGMNVAMRRRFGFVDLKPQFGKPVFENWLRDETEMPPEMRVQIITRMAALNASIAGDASLGLNYAVGHSFFCPPERGPAGGWEEWYETVVDYEIRPLLREYWFDAPDTANDHADKLLGND